MSNIAIIPARGGSKRIPKKNIREFMGKPMIAYSIEAALQSEIFTRVIVSTDDEMIAKVAVRYGAEVPFVRPVALSDDHTGTTEVITHAINWFSDQGYHPTFVCCIYATAPYIQIDDLIKGLKILAEGDWKYVFSATQFGSSIFRGFEKTLDQGLKMFSPEHFKARSQDLPEAMPDAGQFYWGKAEAWLDGLSLFEKWSTVLELPRWRVQDIDSLDDWERAEIIYTLTQKVKKSRIFSSELA